MASYRTKPPQGSPLNWSDPLTKGLVSAILLNEGTGLNLRDSVSKAGNGTLTSGYSWATTVGYRSLSLSSPSLYLPDRSYGTAAYSAAILFYPTATTSFRNLIRSDSGSGASGNWWILRMNGTALDWYPCGLAGYLAGYGTVTANAWNIAVGVRDSKGNSTLYLNGRSVGTTTGATGSAGGSGNNTWIGSLSGTQEYLAGSVAGIWLWKAALTAQQVRNLTADPFRIWKPRRRVWAVSLPARTGSASLSQAGGTQTASGAGSVAGSFSKTQSGNTQTASGLGSIAGSFGKTQDGNTQAASGISLVSGGLSANQAGNTVVSLGGALVSSLSNLAQESQSLSASASLLTIGTGAMTLTGNVQSASGLSAVSGALTAGKEYLATSDRLTGGFIGNPYPYAIGFTLVDGRSLGTLADDALTAASEVAIAGGASVLQSDNSDLAAGSCFVGGAGIATQESSVLAGDTIVVSFGESYLALSPDSVVATAISGGFVSGTLGIVPKVTGTPAASLVVSGTLSQES